MIENMFYTIYKTTNCLDGKFYIGKHQTTNLDDDYLGSGKFFTRALKKHGKENFVKEILHVFDNEADMNAKEAELVTEDFCKSTNNYNICPGGKGGWGYINTHHYTSEKRKEHNRIVCVLGGKATRGIRKPDAVRKQTSETLKKKYAHEPHHWNGRMHTTESKKKIGLANSKAQSGDKNSQFGSMWITNGIENKKIKRDDVIPKGWYNGRKIKSLVS